MILRTVTKERKRRERIEAELERLEALLVWYRAVEQGLSAAIERACETGERQLIGQWGPTGHRIYVSVDRERHAAQ